MSVVRGLASCAKAFVLAVAFVSIATAADMTAEVTDTSGYTVTLDHVVPASLAFELGNANANISVDQIRRIEAVDPEGTFTVTLVSGETMQGSSDGRVFGEWELGSHMLDLSKVKSIARRQAGRPAASTANWMPPVGFVANVNGTKVYGLTYKFRSRGGDRDHFWLPVVRNQAVYSIPFSRIKQAAPQGIELTDGTSLQGRFYEKDRVFEGSHGKLQGETTFGDIEFPLATVQTIDFLHDEHVRSAPVGLDAVITATSGDTIHVNGLEVMTVNSGGQIDSKSTSLKCHIGEGISTVALSRLKGIRDINMIQERVTSYSSRVKVTVELLAKSGNTAPARLAVSSIYFGGTCDLGYVKIQVQDIKTIQIK